MIQDDDAIITAALYSCIPPDRLKMMLALCRRRLPPGCIVQCGVYRGGSGALLSWATMRDLWLFDRFIGMPKPDKIDGERAASKWTPDWCRASLQDVTAVLDKLEVSPDRVRIIGGDVLTTLANVVVVKVALLHIDVDWYAPTRACLERFLPVMSKGGLVIVDDYHHWPGCRAAVDELNVKINEMDGTAIWFQV
ncbi:MAG: TylF/MycF/NovP-related O-methyltransferase [Planctomycetaceae bacterium]